MSTRISESADPNRLPAAPNRAASGDVWIPQNEVIQEWSMWSRLVDRHEEILATGALQSDYFQQLKVGRRCACLVSETAQPNNRCKICYGTTIVGGYEQYGYSTIVLDAAFPNWTFDGLILGGALVPATIQLPKGGLTGTAVSPTFRIEKNVQFAKWLVVAQDGVRNVAQSGVLVEFTTDGGLSWNPFGSALTPGMLSLNEPTLDVQFRVTLTRKDTNTETPFFQVLRVRFQMLEFPMARFSKKAFPDQRFLESIGVRVKLDGVTFWTTPTFGNPGGPIVRVDEDDFFEVKEGIYANGGQTGDYLPSGRFKPATVQYVEPAGHLLSQRWNIRVLQKSEIEFLVF